MQIACALENGGGDTTGKTFAHLADAGRIIIAIVDSDRDHPSAMPGETAKKVDDRGRPAFQRKVVLHTRTAENILPFALYEEALSPHVNTPSVPERLQVLGKKVPSNVHPWQTHANLKNGLRLFEIQSMDNVSGKQFWLTVSRAAKRDQCTRLSLCREEADCSCWVVESLGEKALERAVEWIESEMPRRVANLLDIEHDKALASLCEEIAAWTVAFAGRPT
ncbi:hypothetical protein [Sorangium sp. So ce385]|uniref:hypothetical protein n=1 Tax=Sorangium sp. So ce385 TaxID=3133308 RepID=UPI003F5BC6C0